MTYVEVLDNDLALSVELQDLVISVSGSSTNNVGGAARLLECNSILADILMPDVDQGTCALAVNTLCLVLANDDIGERGALFEDEDSVLLTSLCLTLADYTVSVPASHLSVKGSPGFDGCWSGK